MNKVHSLSIKAVLQDSNLTPAMLLTRINGIARKQLLADIRKYNFSEKAKREYMEDHIKEYEMSRSTLYNILNTKKASRRKAVLIREALEDIIKEKSLYKDLLVDIDLQEYER